MLGDNGSQLRDRMADLDPQMEFSTTPELLGTACISAQRETRVARAIANEGSYVLATN